ncbi:MAG: molecular chaperone HtpG [Proteobacteria bacterium]|nr:molecular chaperone HtpG [Pseudomonadota bacterium]
MAKKEKVEEKATKVEEFQFQAEMSQLLHLITHSLYSHREIFLRELISNASDALNKIHFASLTDDKVLGDDAELKIDLTLDEKKKSLTIRDNGIGMSHDELISNIGTIASSGTSKFVEQLTGDKDKDIELIGRFGVGFYAVFMVADEVTIETRSYKEKKGYRWISDGTGSYTIEEIKLKKRGTSISFAFKKDADEFGQKWKLESTIKKYSDFVSFPITLNDESANKSTAIWAQEKKKIKKKEYNDFFKYISHGQVDPMAWQHLKVEAPVQFKAIMYIPAEPEKELFTQNLDPKMHLYVKRVFIQDDCKDLVPQWLRFVQGVVDSEDLDLNVSRESTQVSPVMEKISKYLVRKILGQLKGWTTKSPEKYENFWKKFGNFLKEGIHADFANKEKLTELYRAESSLEADKLVSLAEYVERMGSDQDEIYYVYGKNRVAIEQSPNLEYFRKNKIEVLYLYEEIDDFIMPSMGPYKEKQIVGIDKADLKLNDKDQETKDIMEEGLKKDLLGSFKEVLGERIEGVIESQRLVDSACTLVSPKDGMNANMERMMKMMDKNFQGGKRVMEINLNNSLIKHLADIQKKKAEDPLLKDCIEQLYEGACLLEGSLEDPTNMVPRSSTIMEKATELYLKSME